MGLACQYAPNQWERAQVHLSNGEVEIDQNLCENAIRPVALGRKNWLHIGSKTAGPRIAAILSIVETCRRLEINLHQYLLEILPGLSERPASVLQTITPVAWKAAQVRSERASDS